MKYSIDTSALLEGWVRHYPMDVFPSLWDRLDGLIVAGELRASEEVLHELRRKEDDLSEWADARSELFVETDEAIQIEVTEILAQHEKLVDDSRGHNAADAFVIALARIESAKVVTEERPRHNLYRPNIPDVCRGMGTPWINLLQLIREERWVFY